MAKIEEILEVHRTMADSLGKRMTEFEHKLKSSAGDNAKPSLDRLALEFQEFKSEVWNILALLRSLMDNLSAQIDEVDNQSRKNALLFGGIEESEGENLLSTVLNTIQDVMGLSDVQASAIHHCHRLGYNNNTRARPILVRFNNLDTKSFIWNNKKKLKSSAVVLSEFLTKSRQGLFSRARKHFGISKAWTYNGNIFIKLPDNERIRIYSEKDLIGVISKFPTPSASPVEVPQSAARHKLNPAPAGGTARPITRKNAVRKPN